MKTEWQNYKILELIPDSVPEPQTIKPTISERLGNVWRQITAPFADQISDEQPYEYLERCLELDCSKLYGERNVGVWSKVWALLTTPLSLPSSSTEPEVWQSLDRAGHHWWHVYDPLTGRRADLASEEEVQLWLEERPYW